MSGACETPVDWREHYKAVRARLMAVPTKHKTLNRIMLEREVAVETKPQALPFVPAPVASVFRLPQPGRGERVGVCLIYKQMIGPTPEWPYALSSNLGAFRDCIDEVCARHGFLERELLSNRRSAPVVAARHELMWLIKNRTTWSLPEIGRRLGGRDHTTVLHGVRRHQAKVDADKLITPRFGDPLTAAEIMAKRTAQMTEAAKRQTQREATL